MVFLVDWSSQCPYCGETIHFLIDPDNIGSHYIEDCSVCCRPITFSVCGSNEGGEWVVDTVELRAEND